MFFSLCHDFGRAVLLLNYSIQEKSGNCKCLLVIMTYVVCKKVPCCRGMTCSLPTKLRLVIKLCLLIFLVFYKEAAIGLCRLFWLHQGRIPRHTCRFHCCLAAHQRTRKKDSAEPSFPILWTPPHPPGGNPLRRGMTAAAVDRDIGIWYPVQVAYPQFRILYSYLCSGLGRSHFSRVVGLVSLVFHYWGGRSFVPAATWGFAFSFVGFALTAIGSFVFADNGMGNLCC